MPYRIDTINKKLRRALVLVANDASVLTSAACSGQIIHVKSIKFGNTESGTVAQCNWGYRNSGSSTNNWIDGIGLGENSNEEIKPRGSDEDVFTLEAGQCLIGKASKSGVVSAAAAWWHE